MTLRIAFMGTPDFSVAALRALIDGLHEVICVYTQPPRPKGRGQKLQPSPVHIVAEENGIPVFTPKSLRRDEAAQKEFAAHNLDIAIVAAYGLLLPQAVLDAPKHGCLNIHASILPRWRGASPIQRAIWAGDENSGVSLMQMDVGLDTGAVIAIEEIPITPQTTTQSLHHALSTLGAVMTIRALERLAKDGILRSTPQDDEQATYAPLLTKEDGRVNWNQTAAQIDRQIRALTPWPGVWTNTDSGARLKILTAQLTDQTSSLPPGTLMDRDGHVVCGARSVLKLSSVQPENANAMDVTAAVNGGRLKPQTLLS